MSAGYRRRRIVHRQLHHVHPKQDGQDVVAASEELGRGQLHPEHDRRGQHEQRVRIERANARTQDDQHTDKA